MPYPPVREDGEDGSKGCEDGERDCGHASSRGAAARRSCGTETPLQSQLYLDRGTLSSYIVKVTGNPLRDEIEQTRAGLAEAIERRDMAVCRARLGGCTWTEIANVLGVSPQAVQQRFRPMLREVDE